MTVRLRSALESNRDEVEAGLLEAEEELRVCRQRCAELEALIARGSAALGLPTAAMPSLDNRRLTLHGAIARILDEEGNRWMTAPELASTINARQLYRKRDGSLLEANQVHARVNNYPHQFEKQEGRIRLKTPGD